MTNYFWVGGTGNLSNSVTANIATSSGGAGGAGPVTASDNLTFDTNSGGANYTCTVASAFSCNNLTLGKPSSGTLTFAGTSGCTIGGSVSVTDSSNITFSNSGVWTFSATSTGQTITSNGLSLATISNLTLNGVGGGWTLVGALVCNTLTLTNGAFNDGGYNITGAAFSSTNSNTRTITHSGVWTFTNAGNRYNTTTVTGLTLNDTGTLRFTYSGVSASSDAFGNSAVNNVQIAAGTYTYTPTGWAGIKGNLDFTGFAGSWAATGSNVGGNVTLGSAMTTGAGSNILTLNGSSGTQTLTTNGVPFNFNITVNNTGSSVQLGSALVMNTATAADGNLTLTAGTFNDAGFSVTASAFSSSNSNVRAVTRSGIWTLTSTGMVYNCGTSTNLTLTDTGTVKTTDNSASSKTFSGGNNGTHVYGTIYFSGGAGTGAYIISGATGISLADIKFDPSTVIQTLTLQHGQTLTLLPGATFAISGNSGFQNVLNSTSAGTRAALSLASGTISLAYVSIKDIQATGGAMFEAYTDTNGCVNTSDNTGWIFFGVAGTGAGVAAAPKGSGSGHLDEIGSGVGICGPPRASGTGTLDESGSGIGLARAPTGTGSGHLDEAGSGSGIAPAPIASGSGADVPGSVDPSRIVFSRPRRAAVIAE